MNQERVMPWVVFTFVLLFIFAFTWFINKKELAQQNYLNAMNVCDRAQYNIDNSDTYREKNAEINQYRLLIERKICK